MKRNESLISGPIGSALLAFVVPLMLSSLVQQLYVTADAVIVGRIAGKTALAAIDSVHTLFRFPINFMNGLAAGATILISRHFGAENRDGLRSCMLSAGALAVVLGILCAVGGVLLTPVLLQFMQVPEDIYAQTLEYTRIYFGGIWAMILYNMASGVLRAFGNSKSPLYILLVSSIINIVGDILLVGWLGMGTAGAAIATVFAQMVSAAMALWMAGKKLPQRIGAQRLRRWLEHLWAMVRTGIPLALQSVLFPVANSIVQAAVNTMGTDTIAAWGICDKLDMLIWLLADAMGPALTTYTAQNMGAGRWDRVCKGNRIGAAMSVAAVGTVSLGLYFLTAPLGGLFVPVQDAAAVVPQAVAFMRRMAPFFLFPVANSIVQAAVNTMGTDTIAAWGICDKLDMLIWLLADAMGPALTTYTAQNMGAGRWDRVCKGNRIGAAMSVAAVGTVSLGLYFLTAPLGGLFVPVQDAAAVVPQAVAFMRRMAPFFLFYALAESFSGACCGTGDTVRPMILTLLSICLLRVLGILLVLPRQHTMECIIDIYISSWIAAGIGFLILWQWEKNRVQKT